jgi:hypothetical protein
VIAGLAQGNVAGLHFPNLVGHEGMAQTLRPVTSNSWLAGKNIVGSLNLMRAPKMWTNLMRRPLGKR